MSRLFNATLLALATVSIAAPASASDGEPAITNRSCYTMTSADSLKLITTGDQSAEFLIITNALAKAADLTVASVKFEKFKYVGNVGETAVLKIELANGLVYSSAADQNPAIDHAFGVVDDGGGFAIEQTPQGLVLQFPQYGQNGGAARADFLATPDQFKTIEQDTKLVFEAGTGSLTVKADQSVQLASATCDQ